MTKKVYIQPAVMTDIATMEQMLAQSVIGVNTTGLNDEDALKKNNETGNPWEIAW